MNDLLIPGSISSPTVRLDASRGMMELAGESYPQNAFDFFAPIIDWARQFLRESPDPLILSLRLSYLNTSSTKCLIDLLDLLENAYKIGRAARVVWHCDRDNERAREAAEEFREDVTLPFEIVLEGPAQ
ncbi:MAG TPA: SiaC family regulatory phosphoprotein [Spirochaetia bacterium]|nr:SiaC family regulatory phosphoprotein [Spirochaetia bacterium]